MLKGTIHCKEKLIPLIKDVYIKSLSSVPFN